MTERRISGERFGVCARGELAFACPPHVTSPVRHHRLYPIVAAALLGSLVSFGLYRVSNSAERRVATLEFESRSREHSSVINTDIAADKRAIAAGITEPWSNVQTEGQITKLKMIKWQMYGRANLDLLQARLCPS
jgi:hypothetical protein